MLMWSFCVLASNYLLVARLHAQEDDISRCTGQTSLQVRLTSDFLGLHVIRVQRLHRLLQQRSLNLLTNTNTHPGRDMTPWGLQRWKVFWHECGSEPLAYQTSCQTHQLHSARPKALRLCQTAHQHTPCLKNEKRHEWEVTLTAVDVWVWASDRERLQCSDLKMFTRGPFVLTPSVYVSLSLCVCVCVCVCVCDCLLEMLIARQIYNNTPT